MATSLSPSDLRPAVDAIQERAEQLAPSAEVSALYVDTSLLPVLLPLKNQVIYGRRGTGKTHLLLRLAGEYRDRFPDSRHLPVYVDGRQMKQRVLATDMAPVSLLLLYRELLDGIIASLRELLSDEVTLGVLDRICPGADKKKRVERVREDLAALHRRTRFGDIELGTATGTLSASEEQAATKKVGKSLEARIRANITADVAGQVDAKATGQLGAGAKRSTESSQQAAEALKVTYNVLTVLDFGAIAADMASVLDRLDTQGLVVLFDEWSSIPRALQPAFADMIRSTLAAEARVVVKFGCIPFHTLLSTTTADGDIVGYRVGEEVFVDADLDRLFSSYGDVGGAATFLLSVLHKHLGSELESLKETSVDDAIQLFNGQLFKNDRTISELVSASAGIPRDFLRIFVRSYRNRPDTLPIDEKRVREAIHDFFTFEKNEDFGEESPERTLFEELFREVCLANQTPFFLVSTARGTNQVLRNLWDRRLIHLLYREYFAFAGEEPGTFDIYVMDYGRFVSLRSAAKGEQLVTAAYGALGSLVSVVLPGASGAFLLLPNKRVAQQFGKLMAGVEPVEADLDHLLDDVSSLVADRLLPAASGSPG
jgi:hypothetical protein